MAIYAELWCFLWSAPGLWPMDCGQFDWSLYPVSNHATRIPKVRWPFIFHWWKSLYMHVYLIVRLVTFIAATCLLMRISNTFIHIFSLVIFAEVLLKKYIALLLAIDRAVAIVVVSLPYVVCGTNAVKCFIVSAVAIISPLWCFTYLYEPMKFIVP